jgi:hypothetical protein
MCPDAASIGQTHHRVLGAYTIQVLNGYGDPASCIGYALAMHWHSRVLLLREQTG